MSKDTSIQWCDSTVNPTMGCDGCELWTPGRPMKKAIGYPGEPGYAAAVKGIAERRTCYAGALHRHYGGVRKDGGRTGYAMRFEQVEEFPGRTAEAARWSDLTGTERPDKPWMNGLPRLIFVSDMSDSLSKAVTFEYLKREIVDVAMGVDGQVQAEEDEGRGSEEAGGTQAKPKKPKKRKESLGRVHQWLWLTKRPKRMAEFAWWLREEHGIEWPDNLWAMTSVTSQETLKRVEALMDVGGPMTMRCVSLEPIAGPVPIKRYMESIRVQREAAGEPWYPLDWAIIGGESEQEAMREAGKASICREEHLVDLAEQLDDMGVPRFLKQVGSRFVGMRVMGKLYTGPAGESRAVLSDHHGGDAAEWERPGAGVREMLRRRAMPVIKGLAEGVAGHV